MKLIIYLLKVNIAIILFYALYRIVFERDTFFTCKRIVLLLSVVFSLFYPLTEFYSWLTAKVNIMETNDLYAISLNAIDITPAATESTFSVSRILPVALLAVYLSGVLYCIFQIVIQIISILRIVKKSQRREIFGQKVFVSKQAQTPFSFFGAIVINDKNYTQSEFMEILLHESTHRRQWHSIDVILGKMLCMVAWFNPFAWKLEHEVHLNLEFLADRHVLLSGCEPKHYQLNLMQLSYQKKFISITNNFNVSFLKKRIMMMKKAKSKWQVMLKYALLMPVIACLTGINVTISAQSQSTAKSMVSEKSETTTPATAQTQQPPTMPQQPKKDVANDIFLSVEQNPEFPEGLDSLSRYLGTNIKYPKVAQENGIQEKITVRFVVEKDGSVSDVTVVRGNDPSLRKEAIRVIQSLPKFEPGRQNGRPVRVYFTLPINFKLNAQQPQTNENALILLDGKEISKDEMDKLDPHVISRTLQTPFKRRDSKNFQGKTVEK